MMWLDMNRIFFRVDFLLFGAQYSGYVHASAGEKYPRRGCNGGNVQAPVRISGFDNEWAEIIGPDLGPSDTHVRRPPPRTAGIPSTAMASGRDGVSACWAPRKGARQEPMGAGAF